MLKRRFLEQEEVVIFVDVVVFLGVIGEGDIFFEFEDIFEVLLGRVMHVGHWYRSLAAPN